MWCSVICTRSPGRFAVSILGGFQALNGSSRSGLAAEPASSLETPKVLSSVNYPAMESGGFGKLPQGCLSALPWPARHSSHPQGHFSTFPRLLSELWVWIQAGILQDAPEGR